MSCYECLEEIKEGHNIGRNKYCYNCINQYMLHKCPIDKCKNVISFNGYDGNIDPDDDICSQCKLQVCENCIVRLKNCTVCHDCYTR